MWAAQWTTTAEKSGHQDRDDGCEIFRRVCYDAVRRTQMRVLSALACAAFLCAATVPAWAYGPCSGSRCAAPQERASLPGYIVLGRCHHPAPAGWGFYLRQRLRSDGRAPLAIRDELGGVTLYRGPR